MRYVEELNYKEQTKSASQQPGMGVEAPPKEIADCVLVTLAAAWVVAFSAAIMVAPLEPNKQRRVRPVDGSSDVYTAGTMRVGLAALAGESFEIIIIPNGFVSGKAAARDSREKGPLAMRRPPAWS